MSPRHSGYLGLSNESQSQSARIVRVNSQVTAVITIFEVLGSCIIVIMHLLRIRIGLGKFAQITLYMLLHFVVLSYSFLMNTRYNKNRIIEEGWMNVLKNMVFCYKRNAVSLVKSPSQASDHGDKIGNANEIQDIPKIFLITSFGQSLLFEKSFATSLYTANNGKKKKSEIEMQQPTCTYYGEDLAYSSKDFTEMDRKANEKISIESFRENMIYDLLCSINDEATYTSRLIHFVGSEEEYKFGKDIDTFNKNYEQLSIETLPHFVGCSKRKLEMRTAKLQILLHCHKEHDSYQMYFDQFVDMEENFLENGC